MIGDKHWQRKRQKTDACTPEECLFDVAAPNDPGDVMSYHGHARYHSGGLSDFVKHKNGCFFIIVILNVLIVQVDWGIVSGVNLLR